MHSARTPGTVSRASHTRASRPHPCLQLRARPSDVKELAAYYLTVHRTRTTGGQSLLLGTPALRCEQRSGVLPAAAVPVLRQQPRERARCVPASGLRAKEVNSQHSQALHAPTHQTCHKPIPYLHPNHAGSCRLTSTQ